MPRVEPGDLPDVGVDGDQLVAAPELFLPLGGPLAVAGVQRLVTHDDPQVRDLVVPAAEVEQAGQVSDEGIPDEVAVLVDPRGPRVRGQGLLAADQRPTIDQLILIGLPRHPRKPPPPWTHPPRLHRCNSSR